MLDLYAGVKAALGASFVVSHAGPAGTVNVTVTVAEAGIGEESILPAVFIHSQVGASEPSNIGGGASMNEAFLDLQVATQDSESWYGPLLRADIHAKVESLIRAAEKAVGTSFFTHISSHRDFPVEFVGGSVPVYTRALTVRGMNLQVY